MSLEKSAKPNFPIQFSHYLTYLPRPPPPAITPINTHVFPAVTFHLFFPISWIFGERVAKMIALQPIFIKAYWTLAVLGILWAVFIVSLLNPTLQRQ
jgi:hypothetical protein